jgi:hypothetical protein
MGSGGKRPQSVDPALHEQLDQMLHQLRARVGDRDDTLVPRHGKAPLFAEPEYQDAPAETRRPWRVASQPWRALQDFCSDVFRVIKDCSGIASVHSIQQLSTTLIALFIFYFPIVQAGYFAVDDYGRALLGYNDLTAAGRPLAALLLWALNLGAPLTDLAPAPQYIAVAIMALASTVLARKLSISSSFDIFALAVVFGANPYYIGNILFRFDSVAMSLGVLCAVLAVPSSDIRRRMAVQIGFSTILLLCCLNLYQFTINCYFVLAGLAFLMNLPEQGGWRRRWNNLIRYVLPIPLAAVCYMLIAPYMLDLTTGQYATPTLLAQSYVVQQSTLAPPQHLAAVMWNNILATYRMIYEDWHGTTLGLLWMATVATGVFVVVKHSMKVALGPLGMIAALIISSLTLLIVGAGITAIQVPITTPMLLDRTLIGWGCLLAIGPMVAGQISWRAGRSIYRAVLFVQIIGTYSLGYSVGNALADQNRYENRVVLDMARDIRGLNSDGALQNLAVSGRLGLSPGASPVSAKFPFAKSTVRTPVDDTFWSAMRLRWVGIDLTYQSLSFDQKRSAICRLKPTVNAQEYAIYIIEQTILLRFNNDGISC